MLARQQEQQRQQVKLNRKNAAEFRSGITEKASPSRIDHRSVDKTLGALEEEIQKSIGHDGVVLGAGMEELAAAWAQAEAEYDAEHGTLNETEHDAGAAASGASMEELAAAWAQAEAEYDAEYSKHRQGESFVIDHDDDDATTALYPSLDHPPVAPYEFMNVFQAEADGTTKNPNANFMEEGMNSFRQGRLKEAIRSFEMELQIHNPNNASAWKMLGKAHAESDQDQKAISCLEEAVKIDPFSPDSLLALAVSNLNEINHERALSCMKEFLTHNPKYVMMDEIENSVHDSSTSPMRVGGASSLARHAFDEVKHMLLAAIEHDPSDAADIHEALGVLYNISKEYELAADSFREALRVRQDADVYQLWNKLGATLANGGQSDQALSAYHEALKIKPKYARGWLNMGISYSNIQDHDEAARCYLQTLSLNPDATHCWTYLRMALSSNERWDLLPFVFSKDLNAFQDHFDFVLY